MPNRFPYSRNYLLPFSRKFKSKLLFLHYKQNIRRTSDTNLMTPEEKSKFLPIVRAFTKILERGKADPSESQALLDQAQVLITDFTKNLRVVIS